MPTQNDRNTIVLKSGIKRAIYMDEVRLDGSKRPFVVAFLDGSGKKLHYWGVTVQGVAYGRMLKREGRERVNDSTGEACRMALVTTASLVCKRNQS